MGKTPHLDFQNRSEIDGSEELYTQNESYNPKEQKFTVNQLAGFILSQLGDGQNGNASGANGLNGTGTIELGGNLNKPTTVNAGDFNLNLKKGSVQRYFHRLIKRVIKVRTYWERIPMETLLKWQPPKLVKLD